MAHRPNEPEDRGISQTSGVSPKKPADIFDAEPGCCLGVVGVLVLKPADVSKLSVCAAADDSGPGPAP
jgi:hypothetical protein